MSVTLKWEGLEELRAELRRLPEDLTVEASHIVEGAANGAAVDVSAIYGAHRHTGNLQKGLVVTHFEKGRFSAGAILKSNAKHAWLFDNGSQARHWASGKSTGAMWGKTAPTHAFVRTVIRARRRMYEQLKDLLTRKGLTVSGDA